MDRRIFNKLIALLPVLSPTLVIPEVKKKKNKDVASIDRVSVEVDYPMWQNSIFPIEITTTIEISNQHTISTYVFKGLNPVCSVEIFDSTIQRVHLPINEVCLINDDTLEIIPLEPEGFNPDKFFKGNILVPINIHLLQSNKPLLQITKCKIASYNVGAKNE